MSLEIHGLDLRLAKKMLFTGVNLRIDKPNLVVYVIDEAGLFIEGADVNILSSGHNLDSVTDALGTALTRFMPAINNTLTVSKVGYATSTQIIYNETPSTLSVYVQLFASEIRLKVVNNRNEPIEGATCRVLNYIPASSNNVLSKDGTDDYFSIPFNANLNPNLITIEALIRAERTTGDNTIVYNNTSAVRWLLRISNGALVFIANIGGANRTCSWTINETILNTWVRVGASFDGTTMRVFFNGVQKATANFTGTLGSSGLPIDVGRRGNNTGWFKGQMSDLRIWNIARTESQINEAKFIRLRGNEEGLAGYWKIDEGEGSTAFDIIGSINGTIFGAEWTQAEDFPLPFGAATYDPTPYDSQTTNANGLTTLNYQINTIHGLEVTLPGKRRFIMPFERTTRGLLDWQVMLSDYLATFATDRGNILINSEPENNDSNFLIE